MKPSSSLLVAGIWALTLASGPAISAPVVAHLANGLPVIASDEPGSGRAAVVLMIAAGDADDPPDAPGASRVLGRLLLEPANHRAPGRFSALNVEGSLRVDTEPDVTTFAAVTTADRLGAAVRLLGAVIEAPTWNSTTLIRSARQEGAEERDEAPSEWERDLSAWEARLGLPVPSPSALDVPPRETLRSLYEAAYLPRRMALAVVGDLRGLDVTATAEGAFGWLPKMPDIVPKRRRPPEPAPRTPSGIYAFVGYPAPAATDPMAPAMEVIAAAMGVGKTSSVFRVLRDTDGTGYESGVVYPRSLRPSGVALFSRAPGRAQAIRDELAVVWKSAALASLPDLGTARARAVQSYAQRHLTVRDRAYWLAFWETAGKGAVYDAAYPAEMAGVSLDDVHAAARRWLSGNPVSVP